jgi:hypothetical protein
MVIFGKPRIEALQARALSRRLVTMIHLIDNTRMNPTLAPNFPLLGFYIFGTTWNSTQAARAAREGHATYCRGSEDNKLTCHQYDSESIVKGGIEFVLKAHIIHTPDRRCQHGLLRSLCLEEAETSLRSSSTDSKSTDLMLQVTKRSVRVGGNRVSLMAMSLPSTAPFLQAFLRPHSYIVGYNFLPAAVLELLHSCRTYQKCALS